MLAMGSIATVIACIAAGALALGARLVPALIRGRETDLMTHPLGFQQEWIGIMYNHLQINWTKKT